jgi:hypothetical protein
MYACLFLPLPFLVAPSLLCLTVLLLLCQTAFLLRAAATVSCCDRVWACGGVVGSFSAGSFNAFIFVMHSSSVH